MTTNQNQHNENKHIHDLSQKFHDRARDIANDLNRQLLNLSTGIVAALFYFAVEKRADLKYFEKLLILITIIFFGFSILCSILGMKLDASKNYFLGKINDAAKQNDRDDNRRLKEKHDNRQLNAKRYAKRFFILGILGVIIFLIKFLLIS